MSFENRIVTTRLKKKELPLLIEKYGESTLKPINHEKTFKSKYCAEVIIKNFIVKIPDSYPFHPPKLFINDNDYQTMLCINSKELEEVLKKRNISCLCCSSILCHWLPTYRIIDIIDEYYNNKKLIFDTINKKLIEQICIEYNMFCDTIINRIISFL